MNGDIYVVPYFPDLVKHIIATGSSHYVGFVNDSTILKYPHFKGTSAALEKLRIAKETAEGVAYAHQRNVLICDIHARNILLDAEFHIKLCDFQGRLLSPDGEILISGGASENAESFMPRCDKEFADVKTDLFALGSTIYHIITGHRPFPQYDTIDDEAKFEVRQASRGVGSSSL
ncbi:hypothetical protein VE01_10240 [Pseudogymnoascus verrucosus]|uniref:Protein kinase domain-containing protein n=1 Tax=Pseudogymnoascus verrucosus TaxID=342668 RepID=A0A1B8G771_9PEZI|nr:uncharacterized protein VE01_10240 [Pseudogymnoascus verrucosus]OBT91686.1 hypothetical protein VE01_10240 [Pseudogymnoascus verrucosus]